MSLAESILQIVDEAAGREGFRQVTEIHLEIGALASVERAALGFCLEAVLHGTLAEGARVLMYDLPGEGCCRACGNTVPLTALYEACPRCGAYQVLPTAGMEMRVRALCVV